MRLALFLSAALFAAAPAVPEDVDCRLGTYTLSDGSAVDIAPAGGLQLRWRRADGTTGALSRITGKDEWTSTLGWTERPDGKRVTFDCKRGAIRFDRMAGKRIDFDVVETRFAVEGAMLAGRLVMPKGSGPVPLVILVHGAESSSARDTYTLQRLFPAEGIGTFVYDKRGTGASSGRYTHDYLMLAADAVAALGEAQRLAGNRAGRTGYQAGSQGGWTAPLAAKIQPVDFIVVSFGLAVSPVAAERESITQDLANHGYGPDIAKNAMEIADAMEAIVASNFQGGYDQLDAVKTKYGKEPWFAHARGSFTGLLLDTPRETLREKGPDMIPSIPYHYDPMPVLRGLDTPQLWVLAGKDRDAPPGETLRRLNGLAQSGRPITVALFPNAEHGMYEFEMGKDEARLSTRAPAGYNPMMRDFIVDGRIRPGTDYGAKMSGVSE